MCVCEKKRTYEMVILKYLHINISLFRYIKRNIITWQTGKKKTLKTANGEKFMFFYF